MSIRYELNTYKYDDDAPDNELKHPNSIVNVVICERVALIHVHSAL